MSDFTKSVLMRFLRGGASAAIAAMVPLSLGISITNVNDLKTWLAALVLAGGVGFIAGILQALDKARRMWNE